MKQTGNHGVNLLPLLDVLLCTMGALIVILGIISRQVRTQGEGDAEAMAIAEEQLGLQVEQLAAAREKTNSDLELARRRLSGIEDHSRQMTDQLRSLVQSIKSLESGDPAKDHQRQALREQLAQLNGERARRETQLQQARDAAARAKPCYAIIPFEGVNKTNRRPIYIECRPDCIVLQPEGIVLTSTDFMGPPGPGNPLASALRAAREYWTAVPQPDGTAGGDPYPLLLVRPDGIIAYYLAREAMASWGSEFGYELIEADWKIEYPVQPDTRLVEAQRRAVDEARQRLQWLAEASPQSFNRRQRTQYRVSPIRGGVVRDGGPSLGNDPFADDPLGGFGRAPSGGYAAQGDPRGNSAFGGGDGAGQYMAGSNGSAVGDQRGGPGMDRGNAPAGNDFRSPPGSQAGDESGIENTAAARSGGRQSSRDFGGAQSGSGNDSQQGGQVAAVGPRYAGQPGPGRAAASDGFSGDGTEAADAAPGGGAGAQAAQSAAGAQGGKPGAVDDLDPTQAPGMPMPMMDLSQRQARERRSPDRSLAQNRGRNWAMPHTGSSVPITRPIRVACAHDRLVILPDTSDRQPQVIPLGARTGESVDQLVAAVRDCTRSWGIAGRGMYWKPQLVLETAPNGTARADDLAALLADSGLDVKRK